MNCLMTTHVALLFLYFLYYRLSLFISVLVCTIKCVFDGCCPNERSYDATSDLRSMRVQQSRYQRGGYHHGNRYWLCRGPNGTNNRRRGSPVFFSFYFPLFFCNSVSNSNIKSNSIRYETYRSNSGRNASNENARVCIYFFVFSKAKYFVKSIFTLFWKIMSSSNNKYNKKQLDITRHYICIFN